MDKKKKEKTFKRKITVYPSQWNKVIRNSERVFGKANRSKYIQKLIDDDKEQDKKLCFYSVCSINDYIFYTNIISILYWILLTSNRKMKQNIRVAIAIIFYSVVITAIFILAKN